VGNNSNIRFIFALCVYLLPNISTECRWCLGVPCVLALCMHGGAPCTPVGAVQRICAFDMTSFNICPTLITTLFTIFSGESFYGRLLMEMHALRVTLLTTRHCLHLYQPMIRKGSPRLVQVIPTTTKIVQVVQT
jgi:hypothetical protein